ncbi:MAG: hypothetical protein GQ536_09075 [Candidatus Aminicenantes bacterium]|nr:hypothetical protein [Candidatus Aminicenantes bacterium]
MGRLIWIEDVIGDYQRKKLKKKIKDDDPGDLKKKFGERKAKEMADIFGEKAVLVSPKGERVHGKAEIQAFWQDEIDSGSHTIVEFEPVCIYVRDVKDPKKDQDKTLHIAQEIGVFRLIRLKTNCTGSWTRTLRHPRSCVWEP